jgi:hypothetical protein
LAGVLCAALCGAVFVRRRRAIPDFLFRAVTARHEQITVEVDLAFCVAAGSTIRRQGTSSEESHIARRVMHRHS